MKFTVIGNPVLQSKSPQIHLAFAKQMAINDFTYDCTLAPLDQFPAIITQLIQQQFTGANITLPFKEQAYSLADECSEPARIAKAANTLHFRKDGSIFADNTDGIGFITDIQQNLVYSIANKNILILGAGGAVRGILYPLLQQNPNRVTIANRNLAKAQCLYEDFKAYGNLNVASYEQLNKPYDLIIDGTSFAAWPLSFDKRCLFQCERVYDLKYSTAKTALLQLAQANGIIHYSDGIGMLIEQAAVSFYVWTGIRPSTSQIANLLNNTGK